MCGIVGYVGSEFSVDYVVEGLKKLEYRGYDSAGVAVNCGSEITIRRKAGKLIELCDHLRVEPIKGRCAIGHTRWATHGAPTDVNAHPHMADDVVLVHNGIIENYRELKMQLESAGRVFTSQTDTELLAHLVAITEGETLEVRLSKALTKVRGAYALAVMSIRDPGKIVAAKNASPLILGLMENATMLASDIPALLSHTREIIVLEEGEMAVIEAGEIAISSLESGESVKRSPTHIEWSPAMAEKGGYKHFMLKEIFEQPRAISDTLRGRLGEVGPSIELEANLHLPEDIRRVFITGCGTSWHAGLWGRLLIEEFFGLGCEVELASELRDRAPLIGKDTVLLAISQSGETADTLAAVKEAKRMGATIFSIVNVLGSSIARESDAVMYTNAGPEISVASTKAFMTQVGALTLLALAWSKQRRGNSDAISELLQGLRQMPRLLEAMLGDSEKLKSIAQVLARKKSVLYLGRGFSYPIALEGALKLKEISYIHAEGYAAGELKHGPIALVEPGLPVVCVCLEGLLHEKTLSNIEAVLARGATVVGVGVEGDEELSRICSWMIPVPRTHPIIMSVLAGVPLQLLAYYCADFLGTDIDQPRNLAKSVTVE
ncbi:MAG: glutamine--fructose-6-phosphate transaminase (isomerizing) [Myxococcota bacterium]|nr:glutamine--fructose-6-phosphate transaminase (isomerizing) [Myxococcota bacterium]